MDGLIAIAFLMLGAIATSLCILYFERRDNFGAVLSLITASVCFCQFFSRIQS